RLQRGRDSWSRMRSRGFCPCAIPCGFNGAATRGRGCASADHYFMGPDGYASTGPRLVVANASFMALVNTSPPSRLQRGRDSWCRMRSSGDVRKGPSEPASTGPRLVVADAGKAPPAHPTEDLTLQRG